MELVKLRYNPNNSNELLLEYGYNEKINTLLKNKVGTARFNSEFVCWVINADRTSKALSVLKEERILLKLSEDLQKQFSLNAQGKTEAEVEERMDMKKNHPSYAISDPTFDQSYLNLKLPLYEYQKAGVAYGISKNGRFLLGDDMGLGKTPQGIALAAHYKNDWPVLVLAPASLLFNWKKEFLTWMNLEESDICVIKKSKQSPKGKITIASYDYALKRSESIRGYLGVRGVLLVDEAHNMKNHESKRTKAIIDIANFAKRAIMISGTPFLSRPIEIWTLLKAIRPHHPEWIDISEFAKKYCAAKLVEFKIPGTNRKRRVFDMGGASRIEEFHDLIREEVMVRRLKTDDGVLDQLPDKVRVTQYFETDESYMENINRLVSTLKNNIRDYHFKTNGNLKEIKSLLFKELSSSVEEDVFEAYRLAGMAKVEMIRDWVMDKLEAGIGKLIVFGHHKDFLNAIEEKLIENKIKYMKIDGSVTKEKRFKYTEDFQNDDSIQVALLSINAASVGLTLTKAAHVLMGEIPWTPALAQQAECRAHRNGQKDIVTCYYAIANGTLDGALWNMISNKSSVISAMLDGGFGDEMNAQLNSGDIIDAVITEIDDEIQRERKLKAA